MRHRPEIGDHGHPSPALRERIADEYLSHNSADIQEIERARVRCVQASWPHNIVSHLRPLYPTAARQSRPFDAVLSKLIEETRRCAIRSHSETQRLRIETENLTSADTIRAGIRRIQGRVTDKGT